MPFYDFNSIYELIILIHAVVLMAIMLHGMFEKLITVFSALKFLDSKMNIVVL